MNLEDLAYALWQMFAIGGEAQRYDDKVKARYIPKAARVAQLADNARVARVAREEGQS